METLEMAETLVKETTKDAPAKLISAVESILDSVVEYIEESEHQDGSDVWNALSTEGIAEDMSIWLNAIFEDITSQP